MAVRRQINEEAPSSKSVASTASKIKMHKMEAIIMIQVEL
jgi:hypothetical protein